jgi:DNA-binding LacI/PurR family transcriptional regulator
MDVARAAGVSKATAAAALNERTRSRVAGATRQRIEEAAATLGYERSALAVALSVGRTYTVGLVSQVDNSQKTTAQINAYQKDVMLAVTCACARAGLRLATILVHSPGTVAAAEITDGRIDGAVLATLRDETLAEEVFRRGFPAVTIGSGYSELRVAPDNQGSMRQAVEHLISLGHRRIAFVGYALSAVDTWTSQGRIDGYTEAMLAGGLVPCILSDVNQYADLQEAFSAAPEERPTACVCFNDSVALGVMRWARARGLRLPDDLSVVGFDDGVLATSTEPPLTTIENPVDTQAELAISLLQSLWRGEKVVSPPPVSTRLIVRESTAAVLPTSKESVP